MLDKRKCETSSLLFIIRLSQHLNDGQTEALSRLQLSMYNHAFENGKDKAEIDFEKATECYKDSPKVYSYALILILI